MASSSNINKTSSSTTTNAATMAHTAASYASDSSTTFVQADPSTFRRIVQKLTGAPDDPSSPKLPVTHLARPISSTTSYNTPAAVTGANICPKRPAFKLHERRQTAKKLEIKLNNSSSNNTITCNNVYSNGSYEVCFYKQQRGGGGPFLVSPVSTLEYLAPRVSPRSPCEEFYALGGGGGEEERAIAEKGFYLHPSPLSTPRGGGGGAEPELLPLFPLTSPRNNGADNSSNY